MRGRAKRGGGRTMQEGGERSEGVEESKYSSFGRFRFGFGRVTFFRG